MEGVAAATRAHPDHGARAIRRQVFRQEVRLLGWVCRSLVLLFRSVPLHHTKEGGGKEREGKERRPMNEWKGAG